MRRGPVVEGKGKMAAPDCWKNSYPRKRWTYLFFDEKWEPTNSGMGLFLGILAAICVVWYQFWHVIVSMLRLKPDATVALALLIAFFLGMYGAIEALAFNRKTGLWLTLAIAAICGLYNILSR